MERVGVILGSGIGGLGTIEKDLNSLFEKGPDRVSPMFIPMGIYINLFKPKWSFIQKATLCLGISLLFEILQFVLAIGASDITDIIGNTLSTQTEVDLQAENKNTRVYVLESDIANATNSVKTVVNESTF